MSMLNRPAAGTAVGETVASVRDYEAAQKTVSKLIAGEVPARDIAIVGQGVRTIERITGRLGYAAAARSGAVNGVLIGLLLSAILVIGNPDAPIQLFVGFVFIGVALGMIMSLITYAIVRRRRDFASVTQLAADHYEVTVLPTSLAKAREVVGDQRTTVVRPPVNLDEPPRYGERVESESQKKTAVHDGAEGERIGGHVVPPRPADPAPDGHSTPSQADSAPRYGERVEPTTPVASAEPQEASDDTESAPEPKTDDEGSRGTA
ncbi:general stress protein [Microbacterium murale]|uniref:General stress protein 17M-like domain-containing protein n=1 Tax=Microbacterium murale TaxID=1081040 RepID=A0ABQ1RLZ2_9MICO|nr:general stress protein [Microbacterium murale]GGD72695.1 hypothetical protein GCM10007269_14770 [Microbacterium murale]